MKLIIENKSPNDYVVATGNLHSVKEFVEIAARYFDFSIVWTGDKENEVGIDQKTGKKIIEISPEFYRPAEVDILLGDPTKVEKELGWKRKFTFEDLVEDMCSKAEAFGK